MLLRHVTLGRQIEVACVHVALLSGVQTNEWRTLPIWQWMEVEILIQGEVAISKINQSDPHLCVDQV